MAVCYAPKLGSKNQAEAAAVAPDDRAVEVAKGNTAVPGEAAPTAAAENAVRA